MISYLGSLVQFSPAAGRAGRCRQMSLCVGSTRRALARQPEVLAASPRVRHAFSPPQRPAQAARGSGGLSAGAARLFSPQRAAQAARSFGGLSTGAARLFPPWPQRAPPVGSQKVFRQEPGPVCWVGGGGFSGAEFSPFPSPLPPTSNGDGAALWSFSVPLFCEPPAVCSSRLIFPLSHGSKKASLRLLSGPSGRSLKAMLLAPLRSAPTCWRRVRASGVFFCWELFLGTKSLGLI